MFIYQFSVETPFSGVGIVSWNINYKGNTRAHVWKLYKIRLRDSENLLKKRRKQNEKIFFGNGKICTLYY